MASSRAPSLMLRSHGLASTRRSSTRLSDEHEVEDNVCSRAAVACPSTLRPASTTRRRSIVHHEPMQEQVSTRASTVLGLDHRRSITAALLLDQSRASSLPTFKRPSESRRASLSVVSPPLDVTRDRQQSRQRTATGADGELCVAMLWAGVGSTAFPSYQIVHQQGQAKGTVLERPMTPWHSDPAPEGRLAVWELVSV